MIPSPKNNNRKKLKQWTWVFSNFDFSGFITTINITLVSFDTSKELTHWNRHWCWERLKAGGDGDARVWDDWMSLLTWWTWVWAGSGVGDGQGRLVCFSLWGHKESDMTEWLNWFHLVDRASYKIKKENSLEKTMMLEKIEGRRRRGLQMMRWLKGTTDSIEMSLSKLQEMVKDRDFWHAAVHGVTKSWTWLSVWTTRRRRNEIQDL